MSSEKKWGIGIIAALALLILWGAGSYNIFVRGEENFKTQLAQIDVQYERRFDLIPNLVESVKGTLRQEQEVFLGIADARSKYAGAQPGTPERVGAINQVETALARLLVVMENYPQLRSVETVQRLMDELAGTENRIAVERKRYNDQVNLFNQRVRTFPSSIIAKLFGFEQKERLAAPAEARQAPKVDLNVE